MIVTYNERKYDLFYQISESLAYYIENVKARVSKDAYDRLMAGEIDAFDAVQETKLLSETVNKQKNTSLKTLPENKTITSLASPSHLEKASPYSKSELRSPEIESFHRVKNFGKNVIKAKAVFFNTQKFN